MFLCIFIIHLLMDFNVLSPGNWSNETTAPPIGSDAYREVWQLRMREVGTCYIDLILILNPFQHSYLLYICPHDA